MTDTTTRQAGLTEPICPACNGAGSIATGCDELSQTICRSCDGTGLASPAPWQVLTDEQIAAIWKQTYPDAVFTTPFMFARALLAAPAAPAPGQVLARGWFHPTEDGDYEIHDSSSFIDGPECDKCIPCVIVRAAPAAPASEPLEIERLKSALAEANQSCAAERAARELARDELQRRVEVEREDGSRWFWQGDGHDHLESMIDDMQVIISAAQLRALLAATAPAAQAIDFERFRHWFNKAAACNPDMQSVLVSAVASYNAEETGAAHQSGEAGADVAEFPAPFMVRHEDACGDEAGPPTRYWGDDWMQFAVAWLRGKAAEMAQNNEKYPEHVKCYPSWTDREKFTRRLADELETLLRAALRSQPAT